MNTRVAWVLLLTYGVLLIIGGFGIWKSIESTWKNMQNPPNPPNTTTAVLKQWNFNRLNQPPQDDQHYVKANSSCYANYYEDPRLYLIMPCGVAVLISAVLFLGGICSRKIFATTVGLHSSLGLWILILLTAIMYQTIDWKPDDIFYSTFGWVIGIQGGMLLMVTIQIILAMWELYRQRAGWPNVYFTHFFTAEIPVLASRVTLGIFAIIFMESSLIRRELRASIPFSNYENFQHLCYPEYYVLPCIVVSLYGVIVSSEGILSLLFGKVHNQLMACTALISAICYAALAIVTSPVFVRAVIGPVRITQLVMIFSCASSILSFLHAIACLAFPSGVRSPPRFIKTFADRLSSIEFSVEGFNIREALSSSSAAVSSAAVTLRNEFQESNTLCWNIISLVVSLLAIILISSGFVGNYYWPSILMLCGDAVVFFRSMPAAVTELAYHQLDNVPVLWKVLQIIPEDIILLTGSIGAFCYLYPAVHVASGIINILFVIFQTARMLMDYSVQNEFLAALAQVTGRDENTNLMTEAEPRNTYTHCDEEQGSLSQVHSDKEQSCMHQVLSTDEGQSCQALSIDEEQGRSSQAFA
ncbi:uncharacterized protein [Procambarus clarkii]|uniref:uncharacterized protein isoform X1 n=1 Tax=Procambarus clarkii TaxID=6728 RepID=UPI003742B022